MSDSFPPPTDPFAAPPVVSGAPDAPGAPGVTNVDLSDSGTSASSRRRSPAKLVGALVGVGALVAAGTFAIVTIGDNERSGGAASPTEVGQQYIAALENEDVLAVMDLLLPGERDTFREPFLQTLDHLKRLEILDASASGDSIGGLDIRFTDTEVVEEPTNVDDISTITLSGNVAFSVDGDAVPIGPLLLEEAFDGERPDLDASGDPEDAGSARFAVVEQDGRWYLSLFHTVAVLATGDTDIPDAGIEPVGADSPEEAVGALLDAVAALDLTALLQTLDPTEAEALLRWAPMFLDDAQAAVDEQDIEWSITDTSFTSDGSGDRRGVSVESLTLTVTDPGSGEQRSLTLADGCVTGDLLGEQPPCGTDGTDGAQVSDALEQIGIGDPDAAAAMVDTFTAAFADYDPTGISVHEVDGRWYVSPLRSFYELFDDVLAALDVAELRDIVDATGSFVETLDLAGLPFFGGTQSMAWEDVSTDEYTTSEVEWQSPMERFPECGAADAYRAPYELDDETFTAVVTAASPCFVDLVAAGDLDVYELPPELVDPACAEGRNPYNAYDDAEYQQRLFECSLAP